MSAALAALKACRKDFSRTVAVSGGEIELWPAPAVDVALMMVKVPEIAEIFDNASAALGDDEFLDKILADGTLKTAFAGLIGISARDKSKEFREVLEQVSQEDFGALMLSAFELSAPRGIADFFERIMRLATVMGGTVPETASIPSAS